LLKTKEVYGSKDSGLAYDDFNFLSQNEDSDSYFRLTSLKICTSSESGILFGLQAGVTKYSKTTN